MKKATLITVAFLLLAAATIFFANRKRSEWIEEKRFQMATVTKIVIPRTKNSGAILQEAFAAIDEVERAASRFIPESEINSLNDGQWHKLSPVLLPMWEKAKELYELSDGRFDPTAGKLISLWGFGPEGVKIEPTAEEIEEALRLTGLDKVETSNDFIRLPEGMRLDLNSLAAGYAADRADDKVKFTDDALETILGVPRVFLPLVLKGCVDWAKENNVTLITAEHMQIINDKRAKEKSKK